MADPELRVLRRPKDREYGGGMGCLRRTKTGNGRAKPNPMMRRQELDMHCAGGSIKVERARWPEIGRGPGRTAGSAEG
jgi:hypothetical protein